MNTKNIIMGLLVIITLCSLTLQVNMYNNMSKIISVQHEEEQEEKNKQMVADFYQELFGDKDISAIDRYIGDEYIQHNPAAADGKQALKDLLGDWFPSLPKNKIDIHHLSADGDLVYIHTRTQDNETVNSVIDIFRIEDGKIVEHWDVIQEVPEESANPHPMF